MAKQKSPNILSFQVDDEVVQYIQAVMIHTRVFNKSEVQREIFMTGLSAFKKKHPDIKIEE